jgi:hypothetical protein
MLSSSPKYNDDGLRNVFQHLRKTLPLQSWSVAAQRDLGYYTIAACLLRHHSNAQGLNRSKVTLG